ncbi:MAG: hypothetical protein S4CHLAM102_08960 [Chlamydiia bacterium]|nr:hypothetical protein [Chlamydiia bacterium]
MGISGCHFNSRPIREERENQLSLLGSTLGNDLYLIVDAFMKETMMSFIPIGQVLKDRLILNRTAPINTQWASEKTDCARGMLAEVRDWLKHPTFSCCQTEEENELPSPLPLLANQGEQVDLPLLPEEVEGPEEVDQTVPAPHSFPVVNRVIAVVDVIFMLLHGTTRIVGMTICRLADTLYHLVEPRSSLQRIERHSWGKTVHIQTVKVCSGLVGAHLFIREQIAMRTGCSADVPLYTQEVVAL